jgi:hypothetical protein
MNTVIYFQVLLILILLITACSGQSETSLRKVTPIQQVESVLPTVTVISIPAPAPTNTVFQITAEVPTPTLPPPPKDTLWWGLPTYISPKISAEYPKLWQVEFDPKIWQLRATAYHSIQLIHRTFDNCTMTPSAGHGLSPDYSVEVIHKDIRSNFFEIIRISHNGGLESINYCTTVADSYTCFGLHVGDKSATCIGDAEKVLVTLTSVDKPKPSQ